MACRVIVPRPGLTCVPTGSNQSELLDHQGSSSSLCRIAGSRSSKKCCMLLCHYYFCTDLLSPRSYRACEAQGGNPGQFLLQSRSMGLCRDQVFWESLSEEEKHPGLSWGLSGSNRQILWILALGYRKEAVSAQVSKRSCLRLWGRTLGGVEGQIVGVQRCQRQGGSQTH